MKVIFHSTARYQKYVKCLRNRVSVVFVVFMATVTISACSSPGGVLAYAVLLHPFAPTYEFDVCKRDPIQAYAQGNPCKINGVLSESPITRRNVNNRVGDSNVCPLQYALHSRQADIYKEIWEKGADPYKCSEEGAVYYHLLMEYCRSSNTDEILPFFEIPSSLGQFNGKRAQDLLTHSVIGLCPLGVRVALDNGALPNATVRSFQPKGWSTFVVPKVYDRKTLLQIAIIQNELEGYKTQSKAAVLQLLSDAGACMDQNTLNEIPLRIPSLRSDIKICP